MTSKEEKEITDLIELLIKEPIPPQNPTTLFEALGFVKDENRNSDFIAWLLFPNGILKNNWLLKEILKEKLPDRKDFSEKKFQIQREENNEGKRTDIVLHWDDYHLIIENKIGASENPAQVKTYLKNYTIDSIKDGCLIYLSKKGEWPKSVEKDDEKVRTLSYDELAQLLEKGLKDETNVDEKAKALVKDYIETIRYKLLKQLNPDMPTPEISNATKIILNGNNIEKIEAQVEAAKKQKQEIVSWLCNQFKEEFRGLLGNDFIYIEAPWLIRRNNWEIGDFEFGFSSNDLKKNKMIIGLWVNDKTNQSNTRIEFTNEIIKYIMKKLKGKEKTIYVSHYEGRVNDYAIEPNILPVFDGNDLEGWVQKMKEKMKSMTILFTPIIDEFVKSKS
ncbi:MAG: PD-(D/E)XK nuclease family protein [Ignavibacteriales bacterium]|nr:PD-(D/E)XK nuclease family protein [Ignavibacteriales bacterium]